PLASPARARAPPLHPPSLPSPLFPYTTLFRSLFERFRRDRRDRAVRGECRFPFEFDQVGRACRGSPEQGQQQHSHHRRERPDPSDRKSTRLNSSHGSTSYAVFCLKKKNVELSH